MKKKNNILIIVLAIILVIIIGVVFFISKEASKNDFNQDEMSKYPEPLYTALYQYMNSSNSFNEYFNNLDNNDKLYIGGIIVPPMDQQKYLTFKEIQSNLDTIFGTDLNVEAKDYYMYKEDSEPMLKYNKETDKYEFYDSGMGAGFMTDLGNISIYNYKIKDIKYKKNQAIITYYGLYKVNSFLDKLTNEKNIERVLNACDVMEYSDTDEEYLENIFNSNKEDFFEFQYTFKKNKDKYNLIDFEKLN